MYCSPDFGKGLFGQTSGHDKKESGGAVAQSVECATLGEEVPGSIPAVATRSILVGSVSV